MSFHDKSSQIQFKTKRQKIGPMFTRNFYDNVPDNNNHRINVSNRHHKYHNDTKIVLHTTNWRGNYDSDASLRSEFFTACGLK